MAKEHYNYFNTRALGKKDVTVRERGEWSVWSEIMNRTNGMLERYQQSVFDFDDGSRGNYCRKCGAKQKNKDKKCKLCGATGDYTYYRNDDGDSDSHPFDTKMIR